MNTDFTKEQQYLKAKKQVDKLKGFYIHLIVYVIVNVFVSSIIIFGLMSGGGYDFMGALTHFGTYSTWIFWGIGLFFHALATFGFNSFLGKNWEDKKLKEFINQETERVQRTLNK